jgi:hypothetical protein
MLVITSNTRSSENRLIGRETPFRSFKLGDELIHTLGGVLALMTYNALTGASDRVSGAVWRPSCV